MFITIINDCADANAAGRQQTRVSSLFGVQPAFMGLGSGLGAAAEYQAAGCMIDILDAAGDGEGVVLVNVAPRSRAGKKWFNGTPFGYFRYKNILVVSTVAGYALSLVKKLGLTEEISVLKLEESVRGAAADGLISAEEAERIVLTQFRSFDFVPRAAKWLSDKRELPVEALPITEIADLPGGVWHIDNFGNCKTTLFAEEIGADGKVDTKWGAIPRYNRLKDVPDGELGVIVGSSGLGQKRFVEIVLQGSSAAAKLGVQVGDLVS